MNKQQSKICPKCGEVFPATSEFWYKDKTHKYGLMSTCKKCANNRKKQWVQENKERASNYQKEYREKNREVLILADREYHEKNKDIQNEKQRQRYKKNKQSRLAYNREWQRENKEHHNAYNREWSKNNPEHGRKVYQTRQARKRNIKADFTIKEWMFCLEYFNYRCAYCGKRTSDIQQDHYVPLKSKGPYTVSNIVPACPTCNQSKGSNDAQKWYVEQPFYSEERFLYVQQYLVSAEKGCLKKCQRF